MQSRNCRRQMLFRVTDGNRRALQAVRCCSGIGPCMTRGEGQTQKVIRRLLQQVLATGSSTTLCFLVSFRSASSAATVVLLLAAVAVLHWRVLVASCSRSGVSPAVAALDGLRRGPAAACSCRRSPLHVRMDHSNEKGLAMSILATEAVPLPTVANTKATWSTTGRIWYWVQPAISSMTILGLSRVKLRLRGATRHRRSLRRPA